jgi:hypothetical protein
MNFSRISRLSRLVNDDLARKPRLVLEPDDGAFLRIYSGMYTHSYDQQKTDDIEMSIDGSEWEIPRELEDFIEQISSEECSNEEKIIKIYQKICEDYTYDDNVLSYVKRNDDETFSLADEYGRRTDRAWAEKRSQHNRRNCFEISRILAKSIMELFRGRISSRDYDICLIWDDTKTHYFVGLITDEYCVTLDVDDFTQLKDITRLKTDLTIEGIRILDDRTGRFCEAVDKFNDGRNRYAKDHIADIIERKKQEESPIEPEKVDPSTGHDTRPDDVIFIQNAIQILKEEYHLDSAGMFEFLKEIVDTRIGPRSRKKVWKEVEAGAGVGKRYTRCLIITIDDLDYLIDVTKEHPSEILRRFDRAELDRPESGIIAYNKLVRDWDTDPYDGR